MTAPFAWGRTRYRADASASATLLEQIAAPVGGLDLVADSMCQRHLGNFEREAGALGSQIAEARLETMYRQVTAIDAPQQDQHRHIAEWLPGSPTQEAEIAAAALAQFLKDCH